MTTNIKLWNRITKPFWLNNVEYFPEIQWILNGSHWQNWAVLDDSTSHIPLKSGSGAAFCTSLPCSSLHWVQLEDSPRFTGIKPKWSTSKSQLPKFRNAKPMCSPLWPVVAQNFNTSEAEELIFDVFQAKSPSSAVHSGFLRPPKEMLPTKSSPPHSLRKWWEIYWATPCADCTIDTTKSSRPHPFEKLGVICGLSHAFPEQHSYDEGNIIQIIHIIHIIHSSTGFKCACSLLILTRSCNQVQSRDSMIPSAPADRDTKPNRFSQASPKKYGAILLGETSLFLWSNQVFVDVQESRGQTAAGPCLLGYLAQSWIGSVPDAKMDENQWEDDGKLMGIWWEYDGKLMEIWSEYVAKGCQRCVWWEYVRIKSFVEVIKVIWCEQFYYCIIHHNSIHHRSCIAISSVLWLT